MKRTLLASLLLSFGVAAIAATPAPAAKPNKPAPAIAVGEPAPGLTVPIPPVLKAAQASGTLKVLKDFPAIGGLQGWVVNESSTNQTAVIYTTADGQALIAGMLVDTSGRNLTSVYAAEQLPKPDHTATYTDFSNAAGVLVGSPKAKAELLVLFDANCGFCKILHRLVKPAVDAGELRVRYIPVAILGADSAPKGAGLLASKNPQLLADSIATNGNAEFSNDKALLAKVQANTALMQKHGFNGTPAVVYKVVEGKNETIVTSNGLPNMLGLFQALGVDGQVEKLKADPALAKYLR